MPNAAIAGDVTKPSSYGQQRLWFFDRLHPHSPLYNMRQVTLLSGVPDVVASRQALSELLRRHDIFRTTFRSVDGLPVQVIHPPTAHPEPIPFVDLSEEVEEARRREVHRLMEEQLSHGFDLERGPLLRAMLIKLESRRLMVMVCLHHIVFDDWSSDLFDREFCSHYDDARAARSFSWPPPTTQYADFAARQRARYDGGSLDPQLAYWREKLRDLPATTEMPHDKPRPPTQTFRGAIGHGALAPPVAAAFRELTRAAGATLFMSLLAAYAVLLHRHSGQTDLAVGTPIADRSRPETAQCMGFFVNTLVLRLNLADDPSFLDVLARTRDVALGAMDNQEVPFERLVEDLRPARDPSRQPLFQTMFVYQFARGASEGEAREEISSGAKFDLTLTVTDGAPQIQIAFDYNTDLYSPTAVARIAERFEALAASIVADPARPISTLPVLGATERQRMIGTWNTTDMAWPGPRLVHQIIAVVTANHPGAPAVAFEGTMLTYTELDRRSASWSGRLNGLGVGPEVKVGLCMERSPRWIVAMLGILRAGGALVLLDPTLPAERLRFVMEDAGVALVLTETGVETKLADGTVPLIRFDARDADIEGVMPSTDAGPKSLAYVIYTSGSTGRPKGVMVEHEGLTNLALAQGRAWTIGPGSRVLQFASSGFDAVMSEVFATLCLGACLHLARSADIMPGPPLLRTLREDRITHVTLPPSALAAMTPEALPDLRLVISAGEPCDPALARRWASGRRLVNAYGPTEVTVCATMHDYGGGEAFPIGRPVANMRVYVLDRHGEPVPDGVAGEIHIGGIGVARGYLNRPELTAERFIPDTLSGRPDARLYRTGDLGRFDASGTLHYLGRTDRQLKVRGYRIEPGEVETVLRAHPHVADAAVLGLGAGPDARLIAYVIPKGAPPLVVALRGFVASLLPDYMAPAAYIMVERWPKTPNGKIDHAALPRPGSLAREAVAVFVDPATRTEKAIAAIWCECLGLAEVGTDDNFFDLGGHSLLLVRVHMRLRDALKTTLSLIDLFRFPTIRLLAGAIETTTTGHDNAEAEAQTRAGRRAALQNAARQQRRHRSPGDRHAGP